MEELLAADFEIGHFIRERIVPRAVLYFTGEAMLEDEEVYHHCCSPFLGHPPPPSSGRTHSFQSNYVFQPNVHY